jgi:hypothetical protein
VVKESGPQYTKLMRTTLGGGGGEEKKVTGADAFYVGFVRGVVLPGCGMFCLYG